MKKALYTFTCVLTGVILFTSCTKQQLVDVNLVGPGKLVSISINDPNLSTPFTFHADDGEKGAIWYKTQEGTFYLTGNPVSQEDENNHFTASWTQNQKTLTVSFTREDTGIHFSITANPSEDITEMGINLLAAPDEYFTGLFERTIDGVQTESWKKGITTAMNLRGEAVDMLIKPTLSLYSPFYLSSNGYGLFFEGTWPGHYDFCKSNPNQVQISYEGPSLSGIIYTAANPAQIVQNHSLNVGPTIVPPEWAFKPWRWRDNHSNPKTYYDGTVVDAPYNSMVVEDVLMMQAYDIPIGAYWVDRPWAKDPHGYADFEWNEEQFPQAQKMIEWLHGNDIRFLLWMAPWVTGDMRFEAKDKGYHIPMKGPSYAMTEDNAALIDFTNPEACKWLQEKGIEKMLNQGVDGFKLDRSEELVPEDYQTIYHDGRTAREVRNDYPVMYVKTFNESCVKIKGDDFMLFPRAGYTGSSKYSGFWGGDIGSEPESLRAAIIAVQRCAVIGYPIWGSDIGGYWQGDLDREVFARWLAFGCFTPIMEVGPTEDLAPWSMDSEPHYDAQLIAIWRLYAKIHDSLSEYTHELAEESHDNGMPIVRPLFLEAPAEPEAWEDWQTFLYGPDILVSAIWEKGMGAQRCYLPGGSKWINAWNPSEVYQGGDYVTIDTPLERIPIFIREGADVNLGDLPSLYEESLELAGKVPDLKERQKTVR